jgi:DNA repair exonuclease SbcCD ATPase subunit
MIFNSIDLENFGIVRKFSKQFDKNILVLAGENGNGKSTLLKGILLAVFDDYEGVLSDYVNWDSSYFQVIVNFTHRGVDYESVVRYEGSTDRTLRFGDKVLKGEEAKKKLKEIADIDLLKAGMLAMEQKVAIVETRPAERREYLKRIYDIEFKRQISDLENDIKASELELAKKTTLRTEIENRKYTLPEKPEYPFGETDYSLAKANLEIERGKLHAAEESIRAYQQTQSELTGMKAQADKLAGNISVLDNKIEQSNRRKSELPELKNKSVVSETGAVSVAEDELKKAGEEFLREQNRLSGELSAIVSVRLPVFSIDEFNAVSQELYAMKGKLTELRSAKDVCPTCGQSISSPEHIARRGEEIAGLEKSVADLTVQFSELSEKKTRREDAEKTNLDRTNRRQALQHQLEMLSEKNTSESLRIRARIDQSKGRLERLDAEFQAEDARLSELISADLANRDNQADQLGVVSARIKELREKIDGAALVSPEGIKEKVQKLEQDIRSYDDVASRIAEIGRMEKQIAVQRENDCKQLEEVRGEIQVLNQLAGDWKLGVKILKTEFPVYVISRVIKDIEKSMNEFLKLAYPKYQIEVQDKKNALHIVYGPKKRDVSLASGYERQIFSLSFMLAISRAIGNRTLCLDECDSAATEKNSGIFYNVLGNSIGRGIDQIILVSHKPATRNILEFDFGAEILTFENGEAR